MGSSAPAARKSLRPPLRIECAREGRSGTHFLGYGANLSETGVFIQCLALRPPGTRLKLVLHMTGSKGPAIRSDAEVRWTRRYGGKRGPSAGMGLRFVGLEPADRHVLKALVSTPNPIESARIADKPRTERREKS